MSQQITSTLRSLGISVVSNAAELEISAAAAGPVTGVSYLCD